MKPSLSKEQRQDLKQYMQSQGKFWTVGRVQNTIEQRYAVRYGKRQTQRLLRQIGMYCYKPQPRDYRQPAKAKEKLQQHIKAVADVLGLWGRDLSKVCIGFADECAPQLQANTQRLWSFEKRLIKVVNTDRKKVNSLPFKLALKGNGKSYKRLNTYGFYLYCLKRRMHHERKTQTLPNPCFFTS